MATLVFDSKHTTKYSGAEQQFIQIVDTLFSLEHCDRDCKLENHGLKNQSLIASFLGFFRREFLQNLTGVFKTFGELRGGSCTSLG
jgi:hypothetical protein